MSGDSLRELEETGSWFDLLTEANLLTQEKLRNVRQECTELTAIFVTILKRYKENLS